MGTYDLEPYDLLPLLSGSSRQQQMAWQPETTLFKLITLIHFFHAQLHSEVQYCKKQIESAYSQLYALAPTRFFWDSSY